MNDELLSFDIFGNDKKEQEAVAAKEEKTKKAKEKKVQTKVYRRGVENHHERRIASELALEYQLPWHFKPGEDYHCLSGGDVDSLTYLRSIVKQQHIKFVLISTWVMAITDLLEMKHWIEEGYVDRIDFYVGEIFPAAYNEVFHFIKNNCVVPGARVAVFRNHSKVMAGYGDQFDFTIESSANMNTNPRTEQTVITTDTGLADFYKNFYDGIVSFDRSYDDWKPYEKEVK